MLTSSPPGPPRIIIADDHEWIRLILVQIVRQTLPEAEIVETPDGRQAFAAYESGGCQFLITNCFMPHMTGPELITRVREHSPRMPILMVSVQPEEKSVAMTAGANWFLTKKQLMEQLPTLLLRHAGKPPAA